MLRLVGLNGCKLIERELTETYWEPPTRWICILQLRVEMSKWCSITECFWMLSDTLCNWKIHLREYYSQSSIRSILRVSRTVLYNSERNFFSSVKSLSGVRNVGMTAAASWEVWEKRWWKLSANIWNNQSLQAAFHSCVTWNKIYCKSHVVMRCNQSIILGRN